MTDPVLAFVLLAAFFLSVAGARYFKTLDPGFGHAGPAPFIAGAAAGVVIFAADRLVNAHAIVTGAVLTLAAVYVRHIGDESEAAEGMLLGALVGASAAVPLAFSGDDELRKFAECVIAGTIAGYGITFAVFHVAERSKQLVFDALTAGIAIAGTLIPSLLHRAGFSDRRIAVSVAAAIPLLSIATVFAQWREVRAQLAHESALGVLDPRHVAPTAHPILRFGRAGWSDPRAHREFVRLANRIALRKRQQRQRTDETARIYQLEIIKLRMQLQQMASIDRATLAQADRPPHHDDDAH